MRYGSGTIMLLGYAARMPGVLSVAPDSAIPHDVRGPFGARAKAATLGAFFVSRAARLWFGAGRLAARHQHAPEAHGRSFRTNLSGIPANRASVCA